MADDRLGYRFKLSSEGQDYLEAHPEEVPRVAAMAHPVTGFRAFLNVWRFKPGGKQDRILGEDLWPGQEQFVQWTAKEKWIFFLKARQLGETTIEVAYDGWCMRFRGMNERVHIFSKREKAAQEFLEQLKFGLESLPEWLRLPAIRDTLNEYVIAAPLGPGEVVDERKVVAYPADSDTARGDACTHAHVDEWAFMGNPQRVWQSIEPSAHGTCHILTTGEGPENYTSKYWTDSLSGDTQHVPVFISALAMPGRDLAWVERKRASLGDPRAALWEYPLRWEDALSGAGEYFFETSEIDAAGVDFRGLSQGRAGRRYAVGADVGRHADAAVIVVLDVTEDVHDVVCYIRLREKPYPFIQTTIEQVYADYFRPALRVEKNSAGEAVLENLNLPEKVIEDAKFVTSQASKARILSVTKLALQNQQLKFDPKACSQLDTELRAYTIPDESVVQDSVMALAIALEAAASAHSGSRMLQPVNV